MKRQAELDGELVALNVACRVAHSQLTPLAKPGAETAEELRLVAIALSAVAPLYVARPDEEPYVLQREELQRTLFARGRPAAADLEALKIRRGDLRAGIEALRTARTAFGPRGRA